MTVLLEIIILVLLLGVIGLMVFAAIKANSVVADTSGKVDRVVAQVNDLVPKADAVIKQVTDLQGKISSINDNLAAVSSSVRNVCSRLGC